MTFFYWFQDNFIHLDKSLAHIVNLYGVYVYGILFTTVFCETGLVVTPFLPGDALLFAIGAFAAAHPGGGLSYGIALPLLCVAAIVGNMINFLLGGSIGGHIFSENAFVLKKAYLDRAHRFFEKYGAKAVVLARFLPIFRTLVPFVAGMACMNRRAFFAYTVTGSLCWVSLMMTAGLVFGRIGWVQQHFELVVIAIIFISLLPVAYEALLHTSRDQRADVEGSLDLDK